jgi:DNA mismatch repair protein MutS2
MEERTMNKTAITLLEYDKIKEKLMEYAISEMGRDIIRKLLPTADINIAENWLMETTETRAIVNRSTGIPIHSLTGIEKVLEKFGKGSILNPEELNILLGILRSAARIKRFMGDKQSIAPHVSSYAFSMTELEDLSQEIERCVLDNRIDDKASPELAKLRKKIGIAEDRISSKLESILRSPAYRDYIQDAVVSIRNGSYVIPVKREYRRNIEGTVLDTSTSGSTVFIEPAGIKALREELSLLKIEEEKEEYRILSYLTSIAESYHKEIMVNIQTMAQYDFLFAKGKYSRAMDGEPAALNTRNHVRIRGGKHPLIGRSAIPLDFEIGNGYKALVITGPNTGGKTVALKTVGLLTMMVQSGLHVPVEAGSEFSIFHDILVDIGDGQSIEQSLSTFSSHIRNIISIMECANPYTLVIIDELGTGTDPAEGMGLAIAVMEELYAKGASILATTHYSEIKEYAGNREGFRNGCMEFDINTLKPLYRLKIGKPGESNAFLIALRLGMSRNIIEKAHEITYKEKKEYTGAYEEMTKTALTAVMKNEEMVEAHVRQVSQVKQLEQTRKQVEKQKVEHTFKLGDNVYISTMDRTGIVCELENTKGEIGVMVMKKKIKINKKRLSLYIDGKELYPEDYNFDTIFESVEHRKKRHLMGKRHVEGLSVEIPAEQKL